jgi:GTPase
MSDSKPAGRSHFVDEVSLDIKSGKGGPGCVSFRREKFVPKGGPDGGDGGKGGDVIINTDDELRTLYDLRYRKTIKAEKGKQGQGSNKTGKDGNDITIRVPIGSIIFDSNDNRLISDLVKDGDSIIIAKGGRGGKGNAHFKGPVNQNPKFAQPGEAGEEKKIRIELKLLADIALIGFPNVGKSSLVSVMSSAKPKISDYPFTTLTPNLGIVYIGEYSTYTVCDVPGLIEGAHEGKGLGHQFLRHIERAKLLACVIDASIFSQNNRIEELQMLENELNCYKPDLWSKVKFVIANKIDVGINEEKIDAIKIYCKERDYELFSTSAITLEGIKQLKQKMYNTLTSYE